MTLQELFTAFINAPSREMKIELYELIKIEQRKQEQAMMNLMYPKEDK
jgi:hypothetical protein